MLSSNFPVSSAPLKLTCRYKTFHVFLLFLSLACITITHHIHHIQQCEFVSAENMIIISSTDFFIQLNRDWITFFHIICCWMMPNFSCLIVRQHQTRSFYFFFHFDNLTHTHPRVTRTQQVNKQAQQRLSSLPSMALFFLLPVPFFFVLWTPHSLSHLVCLCFCCLIANIFAHSMKLFNKSKLKTQLQFISIKTSIGEHLWLSLDSIQHVEWRAADGVRRGHSTFK